MNESENPAAYERGLKKLEEFTRKSRGEAEDKNAGSQLLSELDAIAPDVSRYAMEFVLGGILSRPGLDSKTREMITVGVLTAIQAEPELRLHINVALNLGVTRNEVVEVITQQLAYVGFPYTINGLHIAKEVFDERDQRGLDDA